MTSYLTNESRDLCFVLKLFFGEFETLFKYFSGM